MRRPRRAWMRFAIMRCELTEQRGFARGPSRNQHRRAAGGLAKNSAELSARRRGGGLLGSFGRGMGPRQQGCPWTCGERSASARPTAGGGRSPGATRRSAARGPPTPLFQISQRLGGAPPMARAELSRRLGASDVHSPVRVSTRMYSPSSMNNGTRTVAPVSRLGGLAAAGCGVTAQARIGLGDLELDVRRRRDVQRLAVPATSRCSSCRPSTRSRQSPSASLPAVYCSNDSGFMKVQNSPSVIQILHFGFDDVRRPRRCRPT